jgi:cytosine/adenosine deaminase-related metal-dependent hydrolase
MAKRTLIQSAVLMTMDDEIGTIPNGSVVIEGNHIVAVGQNLREVGAHVVDASNMICMPGFVDTHRHTWAAMLRGCSCNGDLNTYFMRTIFTYGANFTPQDSYVSARLGLAEAIESGITTVHAWEHNIQTPQHARAIVSALRETGIRARFAYGPSNDPNAGSSFAKGTETVDFDDVERLRNEEFTSGDKDLLHLGIASIGVEYSEVWQKEFAIARDRNLPLSAHTMMTRDLVQRCRGVSEYYHHHALGPDLLLIHAIHANPEELKYLAETRTPVSIATLSELRCGTGFAPVIEMMRAGIDVSHSVDTMVAADNSDMFALLRTTMLLQRGRFQDPTIYTPDQVLKQATIGGARALGLDKITGSIVPGKRADIILVRTDDLNMAPLNVPDGQIVLAAQPRNVDSVWIDGHLRKQHGELLETNVRGLVGAASAAVKELARRIGEPVT